MSTSTSSASSTIRMSGLASGLDTESIVSGLMSAQRFKATKIENKITKLKWKQDIWKSLNSKIYSFYTGSLYNIKMQGSFTTKKATSTDESKASVTAGSSASSGSNTLEISQLAKAQMVTSGVVSHVKVTNATTSTTLKDLGMAADGSTTKITINGTDFTIDDKTTIANFVQDCKDAGLNASFDTTQQRFFISSKQSGKSNMFLLSSANTNLSILGLASITNNSGTPQLAAGAPADMSLVPPQDALFKFNGADLTSASNTVTVNGLTMELKSKTSTGEVLNINVSNDTDAIYKKIKAFLKEYNDILGTMNTDYDAETARGYEPLTDEQKDAMSDSEVEKWETKIKDSLLRRDDNLSTIINEFRTNMTGGKDVNGKKYTLASFGITSYNYSEEGKLHIDGDPDDSLTSANPDKLKAALENDPDTVCSVFNKLAGDLYDNLTKNMKSSTIRSALTVYNDKEMKNQIDDYQDELKTMNSKLNDMEARYYKQFSAMETAMSKLNSQSNSLASMLGQ